MQQDNFLKFLFDDNQVLDLFRKNNVKGKWDNPSTGGIRTSQGWDSPSSTITVLSTM